MMKTLIPMTSFVLEQDAINGGFGQDEIDNVWEYAKFLKRPLELGMFIPVDEDGEVLEEPKKENYSQEELETNLMACECFDYLQAKEKVLFNGFKSIGRFKISSGFEEISILKLSNGNTQTVVTDFTQEKSKTKVCYTIEDLIEFNLTLTDNAIKEAIEHLKTNKKWQS